MKRLLPMMLVCIILAASLVLPASAKEGTEGNELQVLQPEQLEIRLGAELAGAQFSLKTDAGMYPGTVVADANGTLKLEIGGSNSYVLSRLDPVATAAAPTSETGTAEPVAESTELYETGAAAETEASGKPDAKSDNTIPTLHIVLFAGGTVLCIAFLILSFVFKRRREKIYGEEDEDV